jgi:DNA-binding CsgD family transcriptional regulator
MTLIQYLGRDILLTRRERIVASVLLVAVGAFTALDVYEDWHEGATLTHIIPEFLIIVVTVCLALYFSKALVSRRELRLQSLSQELISIQTELNEWREKTDVLRSGITEAITEQLEQWHLTKAEQEVSFLLIKGMSIREIALIRETTERTSRHHASEIYRKSGLSGRAQLAAFFLEDLLTPQIRG